MDYRESTSKSTLLQCRSNLVISIINENQAQDKRRPYRMTGFSQSMNCHCEPQLFRGAAISLYDRRLLHPAEKRRVRNDMPRLFSDVKLLC